MNNNHIETGILGENIVNRSLLANGYVILARNVSYKCGELDFVAIKGDIIHFIEVKSAKVIHETSIISVLPEENLHFGKIMRLKRAIQVYMMEKKIDLQDVEWQFDLYTVVIHETIRRAELRIYENLIL